MLCKPRILSLFPNSFNKFNKICLKHGSVGRVAASRKSILFPLCKGSNHISAFISFLSFFCIILYFHTSSLIMFGQLNSFNIYTKCPLNGILANTKTHMQDATECVNSIGYGLFAVKQLQ